MTTVTVNNYCWLHGEKKSSFLVPLTQKDAKEIASVTKHVPVQTLKSRCTKKVEFTFTFDQKHLKVPGCIVAKPDGSTFLYVRNYQNKRHADVLKGFVKDRRLYYIPKIKVSRSGVEVTLSVEKLKCKNFQTSIEEDVATDSEAESDAEPQGEEATADVNVIFANIRRLQQALRFSKKQEDDFAKFIDVRDDPKDEHVFQVDGSDEQKVRALLREATLPTVADEQVTVQLGLISATDPSDTVSKKEKEKRPLEPLSEDEQVTVLSEDEQVTVQLGPVSTADPSDTVSKKEKEKRPLKYYLLRKFFEIPADSLSQYHAVRLLFDLAELAKVLRQKKL